jgi:hypothetical protein
VDPASSAVYQNVLFVFILGVLMRRVCYRARQYRMEATKWAFLADACSMAVVERIWWMALLLKSRIPSLSLLEKHVHAQR